MKTFYKTLLIGALVLPFLLQGCGVGPPDAESAASGRALPDVIAARVVGLETILVEFAEPTGEAADQPSMYLVRGEDAKAIAVDSVGFDSTRMQAMLATTGLIEGAPYTLAMADSTNGAITAVDLATPPRVVGAISTSSTTVVVTFTNNMGPGALSPTSYSIVQETSSPEAGVLQVLSARFLLPQKNAVELTTLAQNEVAYSVHVVNVLDVFRVPIAPPELLVDPSRASFRGTPTTCSYVCSDGNGDCPGQTDAECSNGATCGCDTLDTDGDGLPDHIEQRGWTVNIELTNRDGSFDRRPPEARDVTSDPLVADTDGDGIDDFTERELATDPRNPDTDGDGINDEREFNLFFSNPVDQDSDEDQLDDFLEVSFYKTSPILADTDGDGLDDDVEILQLNRNPRLADLPEWEIDIGDLLLQIDERYTYTDETGETVTEVSSTSSSFVEEDESSTVKSNSKILREGWELGGKVGGEVEFGLTGGVKAYFEVNGKGFRNSDVSSGSDRTTTTSLQNAYETSLDRGREFTTTRAVTREVFGASIEAPLTVRSTGNIAFTISNLELSVLQLASDRTSYIPIATLVPNSQLLTGEDTVLNLGPLLDERGPINLGTQEVFPTLVENLLRAPRGPIIVPSNFDITDEFGRNFAFTSQETNDRTATIVIDLGDGTVEQYNVAIAGSVDNKGFIDGLDFVGGFDEEGKPNGIPLDYALQDIIGLVKETDPPVYDSITAGENGISETVAAGDDVQEFNTAIIGLSDISVIISAGANGVLDTVVLNGDDTFAVTEGYATSLTCNEFTTQRIIEPEDGEGDGFANTVALVDDVQEIAVGDPAGFGAVVVSAGPNNIIDSVPGGDDAQRGPGDLCDLDTECPGPSDPLVCVGGVNGGFPCTTDVDCTAVGSCSSNQCAEDSVNIGDACTTDDDCIPDPTESLCININTNSACTGSEVLKRYKNASTGTRNRAWLVYSTEQIPFGTNFGEVILQARMQVFLGFEEDIDRDGLFARHEFGFGSSDRSKDTDDDGISDVAEVREGWIIEVAGQEPYTAFPDPRTADSDGDGVDDSIEMTCGTDPRKRDTDDDGIGDFEELASIADYGVACTVISSADVDGIFPFLDPLNSDTDGDGLQDGIEDALGSNNLDSTDAGEFLDSDEDGLPDIDENIAEGWDVTVVECDNTCEAPYDGVCQEVGNFCSANSLNQFQSCNNNGNCDGSAACLGIPDRLCPNTGEACTSDGNCNMGPCGVSLCTNPSNPLFPNNGVVCTVSSDCAGLSPFILCLLYDDELCEGDISISCINNVDCRAHCPAALPGACNADSQNQDDECFGDSGCSDFSTGTCGPLCDLGTDCADCGPTSATTAVFSDPTLGDTDFDGLPDFLEWSLGTNPNNIDTDGDGLLDFDEFSAFGEFLQNNFLYNGFFLTDAGSQMIGSDPTSQDTDGDGLSDNFERNTGWRVLSTIDNVARDVMPSLLFADSDFDGLSDSEEYVGADGIRPGYFGDSGDATDPTDPDTDGDGRLDSDEIASGTDALNPDARITVSINNVIDLFGPEDGTNELNEWVISIRILRPTGLDDEVLLHGDDFCYNADVDCTIGVCGTIVKVVNAAIISVNKSVSFEVTLDEPITIEVVLGEVKSSCANADAFTCRMEQTIILTAGDLIGAGGYLINNIALVGTTDAGAECNGTFPIVLEVD